MSMRARHALTSSVDVTVPARMRADASARVSAASASDAAVAGAAAFLTACGQAPAALATRVAPAAAARTETVNSRRDSISAPFLSGHDRTPYVGRRVSGAVDSV